MEIPRSPNTRLHHWELYHIITLCKFTTKDAIFILPHFSHDIPTWVH